MKGVNPPIAEAPAAYEVFADAVLQREALLCRLGRGEPPRDLAGWFITDADVQRLLCELPGLDAPDSDAVDELRPHLDAGVVEAAEALAADTDGRFAALASAMDLPLLARQVLAVVAAVELSAARQRLVGYLLDDVRCVRVSLGLLIRLLGREALREVGAHTTLRTTGVLMLDVDLPWAAQTLSLPARLGWHLNDVDHLDSRLPPGAALEPGATTPAGPCPAGLLLVSGPDRRTRLLAVQGEWPGRPVLVSPVPTEEQQWRALVLEAALQAGPVVLEAERPLEPTAVQAMSEAAHLCWVVSSTLELPLDTLPRLPWRERRLGDILASATDWQRELGVVPDPAHRLTRDQLSLVAPSIAAGRLSLSDGVRRLVAGHLDTLAIRVAPRRGWDDLVLPADELAQLHELVGRYQHRRRVYDSWGFLPVPSTGVVGLFAGASGTGKTLAAEVVAAELGLDLYKIDLSSVVSKYIGETEKNLSRIFDAAAAGDLVLFFDEADALLGKRSEVSDARDRYANIEVAHLLQRLEGYDGLVILATNLSRNIDTAFQRRLTMAVTFPTPQERERRAIWARSVPATAPCGDLDLDFLARSVKITGGMIRNAALAGAFLAAAADEPIGTHHLVLGLKREFQKAGRLRTPAEFGPYYDLVAGEDEGDRHAAPAR